MPKTIPGLMQTHLDGSLTSLTTCWAVRRRDGVVYRFTEHDQDLAITTLTTPYDGLNGTYVAGAGFDRAAIKHQRDTTDNTEAEGVLHIAGITESDVRGGRFDGAEVFVFVVSWDNLARGVVKMPSSGWIGEIEASTRRGAYRAELRGVGQALRQRILEVYAPSCRVDLFSPRCRLSSAVYVQHGAVASATSRRSFTVSTTVAAFSPTAQAILNPSWEADGATLGPGTSWIDEWEETHGSPGPLAVGGTTPAPVAGTYALTAYDSFAVAGGLVIRNIEYAVRSAAVTITGPSTGQIDAGQALLALTAGITYLTLPGISAQLDEVRMGVRWLTGANALIYDAMSGPISRLAGGLTTAWADFTHSFIVPPTARKFCVRLGAKNLDPAVAHKLSLTAFDNARATVAPNPALALGQDRDAATLTDWFDNGLVVWRSGANVGLSMEIETVAGSVVTLFTRMPFDIAAGDAFDIYPGCKKRWREDCAQKFDNGINFQAEPFVPGRDQVFSYPDVPK